MKNYIPEIHIKEKHGVLFTTSLDVAEKFGKQHAHVLRDIRSIISTQGEFGRSNFGETSYLDDQNRRQPMFEMTRDGFSILAMGFTGKKAFEWKVKFLSAFSLMEQALINRKNLSWQESRKQGKLSRRTETDAIQDFIGYAQAQGSTHANYYYKHITTATYRALFILTDKFPGSFRDLLDNQQIAYLMAAEQVATKAIRDGMAQGLHYKTIFQLAKARLEQCSGLFGVTQVIDVKRQPLLPMQPKRDQLSEARA